MEDTIPLLQQEGKGQHVFRVVVLDFFQGTIFPLFRFIPSLFIFFPVYRTGHLNVFVIQRRALQNEIHFEFADSTHADLILFAPRVPIDDIFEHRALMNTPIHVRGKIEAQIP